MRPLSMSMMVLLALAACGGEEPPRLLWNPGAGELSVFPDDAWTIADSGRRTGLRLELSPDRIAEVGALPQTFQDIFADMAALDGFGLTAGAYLRFDAEVDPVSMASGEATADAGAPIVWAVRVGDTWQPWPYEARLTDEGTTVVLEPMVPLPPASQALIAVTDRLRSITGEPFRPSPAMAAALDGRAADEVAGRVADRIAAAATDLVAAGVVAGPDELAGVVVFTTQSIAGDALAIAAHAGGLEPVPADGITCMTEPSWIRCEGRFTAIDYRGADGLIDDLPAGAAPDSSTRYELPFTVWLPLERPGPYGGDAFPVLIFGHGLGGGRTQGERLAAFAAPRGMATIAIDAVRHGEHPTGESSSTLGRVLDFFAISTSDLSFRPLRMRDHFRQSTYDKLQLLQLIAGGLDLDGDQSLDLDPDRIAYLGVSLGGIMGPELLALAPEVAAAVLVVPGGRVSTIVSDAEQFSIIIELMKPEGTTDGDVDRFFPILQTILERGDAAVWAAHLLAPADSRPAGFPASAPHLLMGMVLDDDTVPNTANRALARALGIPLVPPVRQEVGIIEVTGAAPVSANLADGRTAGLLQFDRVPDGAGGLEPATHSNIGDSEVGAEAWFRFLDSHFTGDAPVIIDPYAELGLE